MCKILTAAILVFLYMQVSPGVYAQEKLSQADDPEAEDSPTFEDTVLYGDYLMMPETLLQRIKERRNDYILIDLRDPALYARGHVRGALQYEWSNGTFAAMSADFPRDQDIIVISGNGGEGMLALKFLIEKRFTRVYSIEGGMENWLYREYLDY